MTKRKKILYIGNKLAHKRTATSIDTLGPQLESLGFDLQYSSHFYYKPLRFLHMMLCALFTKYDFLIIDVYSTTNFWYAYFSSVVAHFRKKKYIPILHGGDLPRRFNSNRDKMAFVLSQAYTVVSPSNYLLDFFKRCSFNKLVHIPNSIDLDKYIFKKRPRLSPKLLWVRSFADIYNPSMAIEVFEKLKVDFPDAELCMVGPEKDGSLEACKHLAAAKKLPVRFTGKLEKSEWTALAAEYDIFINTTRFDNMPVSVIEAMALGLPVVSTNVGGIPFMLEDKKTALLVENENVNEMYDAFKSLLINPEFASKIAFNARKQAENYDWEIIKHQWEDLLV